MNAPLLLDISGVFPQNKDIPLGGGEGGETDLATSNWRFRESWTLRVRRNLKESSLIFRLHTGKPRISKWVSHGHIASIREKISSSGYLQSTGIREHLVQTVQ